MYIFLTQIRRRPLIWAGLLVTLTLAVAVSLVGLSAWSAIRQQIAAISGNYVTIAIMGDQKGWNQIYDAAATAAAENSGCVLSRDARCMLGAEIAGSRALSSGAVDPLDYDIHFDDPSYNTAVFLVTCDEVTIDLESQGVAIEEDGTEIPLPDVENYTVEATITQVVSLAAGYKVQNGEKLRLIRGAHNEDGTIPFEKGKSYLVFGYFEGDPIGYTPVFDTDPATGKTTISIEKRPIKDGFYSFTLIDDWRSMSDMLESIPGDVTHSVEGLDVEDYYRLRLLGKRDDGTYYYYQMPECWTHFAECTGSVEEFLKSAEGRVWREKLIPLCELNHRSASVVLTDNLQSLYMFNNGYADIVDGREIAPKEYAQGDNVCIVSVEYAKYNGLQLGDSINIDYYKTSNLKTQIVESGSLGAEPLRYDLLRHGVLIPEKRIDVKKDYKIIGIYSAPAFKGGTQLFTADTIFVPKASVPDAEKYEDPSQRWLQSFILRNGSEEKFFEALKHASYDGEFADMVFDDPTDIDFSEDFMTFNQQYDKAAGNIAVMQSNARRLMLLSLLGFCIVLAAVRYFEARRQRAAVVTMKKLGIAKRRITRELIGAGLLLDLTAAALGSVLARCLFGEITQRAEVGALQLPVTTLLIASVSAGLFLALTTVVSAMKLSRIGLMQTKK